jgi:hypothetical protein
LDEGPGHGVLPQQDQAAALHVPESVDPLRPHIRAGVEV